MDHWKSGGGGGGGGVTPPPPPTPIRFSNGPGQRYSQVHARYINFADILVV